jgi:hypothetical protein
MALVVLTTNNRDLLKANLERIRDAIARIGPGTFETLDSGYCLAGSQGHQLRCHRRIIALARTRSTEGQNFSLVHESPEPPSEFDFTIR